MACNGANGSGYADRRAARVQVREGWGLAWKEFIVRNLGFEGTEQALGSLSMDFQDDGTLEIAVQNDSLQAGNGTELLTPLAAAKN